MSRDALIFYSEFDDPAAWKKTLQAELPDLDFHTDPDKSLCDGPSCLPLSGARSLLTTLKAVHQAVQA